MRKKVNEFFKDHAGSAALEWMFLTGVMLLIAGSAVPRLHDATFAAVRIIDAGIETAQHTSCQYQGHDRRSENDDDCLLDYRK